MNKQDLIHALMDSADLTKTQANQVITLFFNQVANALSNGTPVQIRGFCSFSVKAYKGFASQNPKTVETV